MKQRKTRSDSHHAAAIGRTMTAFSVIAMAAPAGGDGDGSFGVRIIKEQCRPTSQDFSMPETSIKTGDVDFVRPSNEIIPKLMEPVKVLTLC
jgi:hypothetical protein